MDGGIQEKDSTRPRYRIRNKIKDRLKITVVGDGMVGKTCMLITYTSQECPTKYVPTVFDNFSVDMVSKGQKYHMYLWDTAGQEDYNKLRPLSYPDTACFILCFSVGSRSSLENIATVWYPEIQHFCPFTPVILVGTKSDLRQSLNDCITQKEANKMKTKINAVKYVECSAKLFEGLDSVFNEALRASINKQKKKCFTLPFLCCY